MSTMIETNATTETTWVDGCTVMSSVRVRDLGVLGTAAHLCAGRPVATQLPFVGSAAGFSAKTAAGAIAETDSGTSAWSPPT